MPQALSEEKKVRFFSASSVPMKKAPEWVTLFKDGLNVFNWDDGSMVEMKVGEREANLVIAQFKSLGNDFLFDWEHQSEAGFQRPDGKAPAAGWIKELKFESGKGLLARVEWTPEGREDIERGRYKYHSAVFWGDKEQKLLALSSAALTNKPAQRSTVPLAARKLKAQRSITMEPLALIAAELGLTEAFSTPEAALMAILNAIREMKGEGETEAPPEVVEQAKQAASAIEKADKAMKAVAELVGASDNDDPDKIVEKATKFAASKSSPDPTKFVPMDVYQEADSRLKTLEQKDSEREMDDFIKGGMDEGKIVASTENQWRALYRGDAEEARKLLGDAQKAVSTKQISSGPTKPANASRKQIIASANAEYDGTPEAFKNMTSRKAFINNELEENKQRAMTKPELEEIGV